jgi:hypothetical protein
MAFLKINGFHTGVTGHTDGIGDFLRAVDAAGVPFLAYCADGSTSLYDAQTIMRASSVPHNAIFRRTHFPHNQGGSDVPDYTEPPAEAARKQWESHRDRWPADLDRQLIWGETINELRKEVEWADWIGEFCYQTGLMALRDGFKWCGPGYSSGTPDEGAWETPGMLRFLDLCAQHPERLAVALHEYSFTTADIWAGEGKLVGRFTQVIDACAKHDLEPPTIFFTEWGWAERDVPSPETAMRHLKEVGALYAQYPSIKGAAIWALDGGWGTLDAQTHRLMAPLQELLIHTRYPDPEPRRPDGRRTGRRRPIPDGKPREPFERTYLTVPQEATLAEWLAVCREAYAQKQTVGFSYDDAGLGALAEKTAVLYGIPPQNQQEFRDWYAAHYPGTRLIFRGLPQG